MIRAAVLTINLAPLLKSSNSVAIITEVSGSTYLGEVSLFTSLSGGSSLTKTLPPFGVMRMTVPVNAQTITNVSSTTATVPQVIATRVRIARVRCAFKSWKNSLSNSRYIFDF